MTPANFDQSANSVKSSTQMVELFYKRHSVDSLKLTLLESYQGYALNDKKGFLKLNLGEQEISKVFDDVLKLVEAVEVLMQQGKIDGLDR